jgi:predicted permease
MRTILQECKYGLGILRRNPAYTITAILSLALGIAANTVFFTIFDTFFLHQLPVEKPDQLVQIRSANAFQTGRMAGSAANTYSYPIYQDLIERSQTFSGIACRGHKILNLNSDGVPEQIEADLVSGNFFSVLKVPLSLGRLLVPEDERGAQNRPVAVLSFGYWKRRFGGDRAVLGKTLLIEREPVTVVGVAGESFRSIELGRRCDVYLPVKLGDRYYGTGSLMNRRFIWLQLFARLKSGATLQDAQAGLAPAFRQILKNDIEQSPNIPENIKKSYLRQSLNLQSGAQGIDNLRRRAQDPIKILWLVVISVLLIACANVAGLQLAQAVHRRKEIALRLGLGASRWRLARLLLIESLLLSVLGGAAGLMLGWWALSGLQQMLTAFNLLEDFSGLNLRVLGLTACATLGSAVLFGCVPAFQAARVSLMQTLRSEGTAVSAKSSEVGRRILAVSQIAMSMLLLVVSGLFFRTLLNMYRIDPRFANETLMEVRFEPQPNQYSLGRAEALAQDLAERVRGLPGVRQALLSNDYLLSDGQSFWEVRTDGHPDPSRENLEACEKSVSPGYFSGLGIPLLAGRDFSQFDKKDSPAVAIVNEAFAQYFFNGQNPVGQSFKLPGINKSMRNIEIVGMVGNAFFGDLRNKTQRTYFLCLNQTGFYSGALHMRIDGNPHKLAQAIRGEMAALDPSLPLWSIKTFEEEVAQDSRGPQALAIITGIFSTAATLMAAVGIFGLLSFFVAQRTREIGIRMALGAERGSTIWLVLKQTLILSGIGLGIGLAATLAISRLLSSMLYEVEALDPLTLVLALIFIGAVALIASLIPARRAAAVDPIEALRSE